MLYKLINQINFEHKTRENFNFLCKNKEKIYYTILKIWKTEIINKNCRGKEKTEKTPKETIKK